MNYTKGKWETVKNSEFYEIRTWNNVSIRFTANVFVYHDGEPAHHSDEAKANIKLISKAPEMYEALKVLLIHYDNDIECVTSGHQAYAHVRSLLNEIENES